VYYTPEQAVQYIVRSIDEILVSQFGLAKGLANKDMIDILLRVPGRGGKEIEKPARVHKVQILDPACGTGTFLYAVIDRIYRTFGKTKGMWPDYASKHLLPRLFGFELLMAPYAVAHLKLALELSRTGYNIASAERLRIFLTNALERAHDTARQSLFAQWLADEASAAIEIKRNAPIMVVLGNPPYSGHSANKGAWIEGLMKEYKKSPALKKPAQAKWVSNDYVKFVRFAQWRIEQTGYGILGFVTSHSWLDNPSFVDMRASLMKTFDTLYIIDAHGDSVKNEKPPPGTEDQNIFDIQQGVAISLMVRTGRSSSGTKTIQHYDLWGSRQEKYDWLEANSVNSTSWTSLNPEPPKRLFVPQRQSTGLAAEYDAAWSVADIMNVNGDPVPGFVTTHDDFAISYTGAEALAKVESLLATSTEEEARALFKLCAQDQWLYERAKANLTRKGARKALISVAFRPFDTRVTIYDRNVLVHRRERMSRHMLKPNVALSVPKNAEVLGGEGTYLFFCTDRPTDYNMYRRGGAHLLPLYVYPDEKQLDLLADADAGPQENVSAEFRSALEAGLGRKLIPASEIFAYIYAVLWSAGYNKRYRRFLNRGFARVPVTSDARRFDKLARLGQNLIDVHLMKKRAADEPGYPVAGDDEVSKIEKKGDRVYINPDQYFEGVSDAAWGLEIGAHPVAYTWLKYRKERADPRLTFDELEAFRGIIAALDETIRIQGEIDKAIGSWPLQ